jgi:DNA-binding NarL/FixJ family response regulator
MYGKAGAVVIADGDERARSLAAGSLRRAGYTTIEVESGAEALEVSRAEEVGLVVLEVVLPDMTGYDVCRDLRRENGDAVPIFLVSGTRTEAVDRVAGLVLGADDFIVKPVDPSELVARVQRFVDRQTEAPPRRRASGRPVAGPTLTGREREVLDLLASGRKQKEIATVLSISPKTVGAHIQNLFSKVGVHSRAELVARAHQLDLVAAA